MQVLTGDENGILKLVNVKEKSYLTFGAETTRTLGVTSLAALPSEDTSITDPVAVAVLRKNGSVDIWNRNGGEVTLENTYNLGLENPLGAIFSKNTNQLLSFSRDGEIVVSPILLSDSEATLDDSEISRFSVQGPLSTGAVCSNAAMFAGKENDIQLYDLENFKSVWAAKNVAFDKIGLRVPVWPTSVKFFDPSNDSISGAKFVSGTAYKHVRVYDTRESEKPVISFDMSDEYRVTCLQPLANGHHVLVGDTVGGLHLWDLRNQRRVRSCMGFSGSIRDINLSADGNRVAAVSLDRFLRVYSTSDCKVVSHSYLKNRLNQCVFWDYDANKNQNDSENEGDSNEEDILEEQSDEDSDNGNKKSKKSKPSANKKQPQNSDDNDNEDLDDNIEDFQDSDEDEDDEGEENENEDNDDDNSDNNDEDDDNEEEGEEDDEDEDEDEDDEEEDSEEERARQEAEKKRKGSQPPNKGKRSRQ